MAELGRRSRFRFWRVKPWGFDSLCAHQGVRTLDRGPPSWEETRSISYVSMSVLVDTSGLDSRQGMGLPQTESLKPLWWNWHTRIAENDGSARGMRVRVPLTAPRSTLTQGGTYETVQHTRAAVSCPRSFLTLPVVGGGIISLCGSVVRLHTGGPGL